VTTAAAELVLRPWLRGTFHRMTVPIAITLTVIAAVAARSGGARAAVIIYGVCVTAMFLTSGVYHARRLAHRSRSVLRRLDHSMILVAISGSYTPVIVLALDGATRVVMLVLCWVIAVVGVAVRMWWMDAPKPVIALVYLGAGWQMLLALPAYLRGLTPLEMALTAVGGVLYTLGALIFSLGRPNPWPRIAGYHEVFHLFVVVAFTVQWFAVYSLVS